MTSGKKTIALFDVDGTLTAPRQVNHFFKFCFTFERVFYFYCHVLFSICNDQTKRIFSADFHAVPAQLLKPSRSVSPVINGSPSVNRFGLYSQCTCISWMCLSALVYVFCIWTAFVCAWALHIYCNIQKLAVPLPHNDSPQRSQRKWNFSSIIKIDSIFKFMWKLFVIRRRGILFKV